MNCEEYMDQYLMLDKNEKVPGTLTRHFLTCKKCRNEVKALVQAEKLAARPLKIKTPVESKTIENAVKELDPNYNPYKNRVHIWGWILFGVLLIACLTTFGIITPVYQSDSSQVFFYLAFAGTICGYCALFIGSNLDFFVKRIETIGQPK